MHNEGHKQRMRHAFSVVIGGAVRRIRRTSILGSLLAAAVAALWLAVPVKPAAAADPAVVFMAQVGRELMAAARTRSPSLMAAVVQKYADVRYIGDYSLGAYRARMADADREEYHTGMVRFIAHNASLMAPKYPVRRVEWAELSTRGAGGVFVDCTVVLADGSPWEVRWVLRKIGGTYKVRDAEIWGIGAASYLKQAFEDFLAQNGGRTRALVTALNR
jgi:ABC-type transporter MlaC component